MFNFESLIGLKLHRIRQHCEIYILTTLLRNTNSLATPACHPDVKFDPPAMPIENFTSCFGVLPSHPQAPEMPQTTMRPNFFEALKIFT